MSHPATDTIVTSWFECMGCGKPCEVLNLSTGSESLCCSALVKAVMQQRISRSALPASHPDGLKPCPKCGLPCSTYESRLRFTGVTLMSACCSVAMPKPALLKAVK